MLKCERRKKVWHINEKYEHMKQKLKTGHSKQKLKTEHLKQKRTYVPFSFCWTECQSDIV